MLLRGESSSDGDPAADRLEYLMGTDPTDPASYLRVALETTASGGYELAHRAEPGRDYRLLASADLAAWSPAGHWRYGEGQWLKYPAAFLTVATGLAFFKVEVQAGSPRP